MTSQPSIASAMLRYCRGEREGFEELYRGVAPHVFALLMDGTGDRELAASLLELTFRSLHTSRSLYVEGAGPVPWITAIARRELELARRRGAPSHEEEKPAVARRAGLLFSWVRRSSGPTESLGPKAM